MSRFPAFATAISMVLAACSGADVEGAGTTDTTQSTSVSESAALEPTSTTDGAAATTSSPEVKLERVAHGPWFEGSEGSAWMTSVTAGGPGLVAAGAQGDWLHTDAAVWTSSDGHNWVRVDHDPAVFGDESSAGEAESAQLITDLVSGSLGLVAVGADGGPYPDDYDAAVWLSTDGVAWERLPHDEEVFGGVGDQIMHSVVQTSDAAVVVGESAGQATVWVSNDGREWTQARIDGAPGDAGTEPTAMFDVAVGGLGLVAVGSFESSPAVWLSADGLTWSRLPDDTSGGSSGVEGAESTVGRMTLVAAGDEGLVAIGATAVFDWPSFADPVVWTSNDGFEWHMLDAKFAEAPTATLVALGDVAWDGDLLVAVGGHESTQPGGWTPGLATLWVSVDSGLTWQVGSEKDTSAWVDPPLPLAPGHLTRLGSSIVVVGTDSVPTGEVNGYMQYANTAAVWIASVTEG